MSLTPGPWFYRTSGDGFVIRSKAAIGPIAGVNGFRPIGEAEANAHRIVTAVNAFDDMKAALVRARVDLQAAKIVIESYKNASAFGIVQTLEIVSAALSKAEGHIGQELASGESAQ